MIVGAHALAIHGVPRATGDLDIWVRPDPTNARKAWDALAEFGAPMAALDLRPEDLEHPGTVFQLGLPPRRIDVLTQISGVEFDAAWSHRAIRQSGEIELPFLGRRELEANKKAAGRPKDLADLALLDESQVDEG